MRASWGFALTPSSRRLVYAAGASCLLAIGCGVDDRSLTLGSSGADNSGSGGSSIQAGSPGASPTAGSAPLDVEIPVCTYATDSVTNGCETLAKNAGFQTDTDSWQPKPGILGAWVDQDATEASGSGSMRVVNFLHGEDAGVAPGAAEQCLPARAGQVVDVAGDVFIKEGQGQGLEGGPYKGQAGLALLFFKGADCSGGSIGNAATPLTDVEGTWTHTEGSARAPEQTQSVAVQLNTLMPFREYKFEAQFDNVFVRMR